MMNSIKNWLGKILKSNIKGDRRSVEKKKAIDEFLRHDKIAVVGASTDRDKYGNKVFRRLQDKGLTVYPVNPQASSVEGVTAYPSLKDLPEQVDGIVLVVPPAVTDKIVQEALDLGIERIWMQPGAESEQALKLCREKDICYIDQECIMVKMIRR